MKKIKLSAGAAALLLLFLIMQVTTSASGASMIPTPPATDPDSIGALYFYCITNDTVIASHNAGESLPTSTSAKVMMGLILCEELSGRLDETVTVSGAVTSLSSGKSLHLADGEKVTVRDLLYAAICGTYNDAAYVLAHLVGGSADGFVSIMNKRASKLGATNTNYVNPIGYPDHESMKTTAVDVAKIAMCACENPLYMEISSARTYDMAQTSVRDAQTIYNSNYLISSHSVTNYFDTRFSGMNGGYTGEEGGWSLVTIADDGGAKYLCIILGGKESGNGHIYSYKTANELFSWAAKTYGFTKVFDKGYEVGMTSIKNTALTVNNAAYLTADELSVYIPQGINFGDRLKYTVQLDEDKLVAPVTAGTVVGKVKVTLEGHVVGSCDLILRDSYDSNFISEFMNNFSAYFSSRPFFISIAIFVVAAPLALLLLRLREIGAFKNKTFRIFKK